ncbi:MAG: alpha/beta fold hydrolase, partial [Planctomycetota bacterium]
MTILKTTLVTSLIAVIAWGTSLTPSAPAKPSENAHSSEASTIDGRVHYRTAEIDGLDIFYREAGPKDAPTLLLLHGFPTSSHMFRDLIPQLADRFHIIAPDYPGYGNSSMPSVKEFDYSFDNLASIVDKLVEQLDVPKYSLYLMDYGAPIGFRIAAKHPERVQSLIIQNGNAYDEGIDNVFWAPIKEYWKDRNAINKSLNNEFWINVKRAYNDPELPNEKALGFVLSLDATKWQYTHGVRDTEAISPDTWGHVQPLLDREGNRAIQLELFYSYGTNPP